MGLTFTLIANKLIFITSLGSGIMNISKNHYDESQITANNGMIISEFFSLAKSYHFLKEIEL